MHFDEQIECLRNTIEAVDKSTTATINDPNYLTNVSVSTPLTFMYLCLASVLGLQYRLKLRPFDFSTGPYTWLTLIEIDK